ncbi:hypothetical protein EDD59_104167 [Muricomes intestini]|jgi:hypothetical protein|uniref:Uncharacterized protein n=1 Tax=Muricomes intestini TaxID=1796634 RepID=A0A4R3KDT8_9FIRM|nr:hypothetical protein EDD59_104167 [Muricomes intestini]
MTINKMKNGGLVTGCIQVTGLLFIKKEHVYEDVRGA